MNLILLERREKELRGMLNQWKDDMNVRSEMSEGDYLRFEELKTAYEEVAKEIGMLRFVEAAQVDEAKRDVKAEEFQRSFSLMRFLQNQCGMNVDAGREKEISDEIRFQHDGYTWQGSPVPFSVLDIPFQRATLLTTAATTGDHLVQAEERPGDFIWNLRPNLVSGGLGIRELSLKGNPIIPRLTSNVAPGWVAEAAAVSEVDFTFDEITMSPKGVGMRAAFSRNLMLQSDPAIEGIMREEFNRAMAQEVDRVTFLGSGASDQPTGVVASNDRRIESSVSGDLYWDTVATGTRGTALDAGRIPDWADLLYMKEAVDIAHTTMSSRSWVCNPQFKYKMMQTKKDSTATSGDATSYIWHGAGVLGETTAVTTLLPQDLDMPEAGSDATTGYLIYGEWNDMIRGTWGGLDVLVNPYGTANFNAGNVAIRAIALMDFAYRHNTSIRFYRGVKVA